MTELMVWLSILRVLDHFSRANADNSIKKPSERNSRPSSKRQEEEKKSDNNKEEEKKSESNNPSSNSVIVNQKLKDKVT